MRNQFIVLGLAWAASTGAFGAQMVTNQALGYRISFPDGWTVIQDKDDPAAVAGILAGAKGNPLCVVAAERQPRVPGRTQAQINDEMRAPLGKDEVLASLTAAFKDPAVMSSESRMHPSGLQIRESVVSYTDMQSGDPLMLKVSAMNAIEASYAIACGAERTEFAKHVPAFGSIVESFAPGPGPVADANPLPGALTQPVAARVRNEESRERISAGALAFSKARSVASQGAKRQ